MRFSNKISLVLDSKLPFLEVKEGKFSDDELVERLKESFNEAWSKTGEALEYALDNRIFFRSVLYTKIDNFIGVLNHECWIYIYSADEPEFLLKRYEEDSIDFIKRRNERDKLLGEIEDEFRALLGVDNSINVNERSTTFQ
jgi:hypothetical protein